MGDDGEPEFEWGEFGLECECGCECVDDSRSKRASAEADETSPEEVFGLDPVPPFP